MPYLVSEILGRASKELYDEAGMIWNNQAGGELMQHLNSSVSDIVDLDATAKVFNGTFAMIAGSKQLLPGDAVTLIENESYNLRPDGSPGRYIFPTTIKRLAARRPNWLSSPASSTVRHIMMDAADPRTVWNWPPVPANVSINLAYGMVPNDVLNLTDPYPLPDMYAEATFDYIMWHALAREDKYGNMEKAAQWKTWFETNMGVTATSTTRAKAKSKQQ